MSMFITAVPLFTSEMVVDAYWLRYQSGEKFLGLKDDSTALSGITDAPDIELVNELGIEPFTGGKPLFISVNQFQILGNVPQTIKAAPRNICFIVRRDTIDDPECFARCQQLKNMGYSLAVRNYFKASNQTAALEYLKLCDYVMLDTTHTRYRESLMKALTVNRKQQFILANILTNEEFKQFKSVRNALYEGRFYSLPITVGEREISALKLNALQLLNIVAKPDFDLEEVSGIIQNDPAISISLLRFINSPGVGVSQKVTSIKNAVTLLGQNETKKWIYAAVSVQLSADKPNEISKLSLIRAKFAENLAGVFRMQDQSQALFMMGLFSLLDVILERPMDEAMREVALDKNIQDALVSHAGPYNDVRELIFNYERAEWESVALVMIRHELDAADIEKAFIDAMSWYGDMLRMQMA